jgi:hypothetical protein
MNRKCLLALIALVVVVLAVSASWFLAADRFEASLDDWLASRQADGVDVHFDAKRISGFPFGFYAILVNPQVTVRTSEARPDGWSWKAPELKIGYRILSSQLQLSAAGPHDIVRRRANTIDTLRLESAGLEVTLPRRKSDEREVDIAAKAPKLIINAVSASASSFAATLKSRHVESDDHLGDAGDVDLTISGLSAAVGGVALSSAVVDLSLSARLLGPLPPGRMKDSAVVWRDAGGTIEVSHLGLKSGPVDIEGTGTVALDTELRPLAAFSAQIQGYDAVIDQLVADGTVAPKNAEFARAVLAAMAGADAATGKSTLALPVSSQDGWLYLGPARLAKVPPLPLD